MTLPAADPAHDVLPVLRGPSACRRTHVERWLSLGLRNQTHPGHDHGQKTQSLIRRRVVYRLLRSQERDDGLNVVVTQVANAERRHDDEAMTLWVDSLANDAEDFAVDQSLIGPAGVRLTGVMSPSGIPASSLRFFPPESGTEP